MELDRRVIRDMAQHIQDRLVRRTVAYLRRLPATLSGEHSGLRNVWQEICVQVQGEHSFYWSAYEETIHSCVAGLVAELAAPERAVLSAATWEGDDCLDEAGDGERSMPIFLDELLRDICEGVTAVAMEDRPQAVRKYLERYQGEY